MKTPSFQFYPGDWKRDTNLQACSLAARGLWIELLCIAHDCDDYGVVAINGKPISDGALARMCGIDLPTFTELIAELEHANVLSRKKTSAIYSRRMTRDAEKREGSRRFGALGGNPKLMAGYDKAGQMYCMQRPSDRAVKIGVSVSPAKRRSRVAASLREDVDLLFAIPVQNMGKAEAEAHKHFEANRVSGEWFSVHPDKVKEYFHLIRNTADEDEEAIAVEVEEENADEIEYVISQFAGGCSPHVAISWISRIGFAATKEIIARYAGKSWAYVDKCVDTRAKENERTAVQMNVGAAPMASAREKMLRQIERWEMEHPRPLSRAMRGDWEEAFAAHFGFTVGDWNDATEEQVERWAKEVA